MALSDINDYFPLATKGFSTNSNQTYFFIGNTSNSALANQTQYQQNKTWRGISIVGNVTSTNGNTLTATIYATQKTDPSTNLSLVSQAVSTNAPFKLTVYPGGLPASSSNAADVLPCNFAIAFNLTNSNLIAYSAELTGFP